MYVRARPDENKCFVCKRFDLYHMSGPVVPFDLRRTAVSESDLPVRRINACKRLYFENVLNRHVACRTHTISRSESVKKKVKKKRYDGKRFCEIYIKYTMDIYMCVCVYLFISTCKRLYSHSNVPPRPFVILL